MCSVDGARPDAGSHVAVSTATLRGWLAALPGLVAVDDADRVDQLRLLEEVKAATAAAQARVS
ncbi:MAG TPA: hypothetical protein VFX52_02380, partial [Nocardioidaceae bacterium]|nr:hypothetical protein [Nocardioidaceae bacterium]